MKQLLFILTGAVIFTSCNLYKPALINTPLLETQSDGNASVSLGRTFGVQASYSPLKNIGVMVNYSNALPVYEYQNVIDEPEKVLINTYANQQYEFGLGYYKRLTEQYYFELYVGYSAGESGVVENNYFIARYDTDFNLAFEVMHEGWFLQPTFSVIPEKNIELAFSAKLANIQFYNFNPSPFFDVPPNFFTNSSILSLQPTMTFVFKQNWYRGFFQCGFFFSEYSRFYRSRWMNASFGIGLNINQLKQTINENRNSSDDYR